MRKIRDEQGWQQDQNVVPGFLKAVGFAMQSAVLASCGLAACLSDNTKTSREV